jgi:hypothetical protein
VCSANALLFLGGARLPHRLREGLGRAMDLSVGAALEGQIAAAFEASMARVAGAQLSLPPGHALPAARVGAPATIEGTATTPTPASGRLENAAPGPWWVPLTPARAAELLWCPGAAPQSEVERAKSQVAALAAAMVVSGLFARRPQ